jgi:hypothetical protein
MEYLPSREYPVTGPSQPLYRYKRSHSSRSIPPSSPVRLQFWVPLLIAVPSGRIPRAGAITVDGGPPCLSSVGFHVHPGFPCVGPSRMPGAPFHLRLMTTLYLLSPPAFLHGSSTRVQRPSLSSTLFPVRNHPFLLPTLDPIFFIKVFLPGVI